MSKRSPQPGKAVLDGFNLNVFSESSLDQIHNATLEVLWHEGIKTNCKKAKEIYHAGGCFVDDKKDRVHIPPHIVESAIDSSPSTVLYAGRVPENDIIFEAGRVNFCNFSKSVNVIDLYDGKYRMSCAEDNRYATLIVDKMEQYDLVDIPCEAHDLPDEIGNLANYEIMMSNTTKHCNTSCHNTLEAEKFIEMAAAIAGGKENLLTRPLVSTLICPISPLCLSTEATEPIITFAENRMPLTVLSMALAGGTTPVTLAGTLVTHNCESLAGIVLAQLTRKGTPNNIGSSTSIMDMASGLATVGCPELGMLSAGIAKIAQYYKIPCYVAGG